MLTPSVTPAPKWPVAYPSRDLNTYYYCHSSFFEKSSWQPGKGHVYRSFLYSTGYNLLFFISRKMEKQKSNCLILAVQDLKYWCSLYLRCSACQKITFGYFIHFLMFNCSVILTISNTHTHKKKMLMTLKKIKSIRNHSF